MDELEQYRPLLFGIAYRMLGSAMEAEDMVQETLLRYSQLPSDQIHTPKAYLSKMITHLCLDHLKSARSQREMYFGTWLPEPLLTPSESNTVELESLSMAFLVLLEKLTPTERAVFLLHEVFDYTYAEIADILGREQADCRQLLHRAKGHISAERPRFTPSRNEQDAITARFMEVSINGDLQEFVDLLAEDVTLWSDGGGKAKAAVHPLVGREPVAKFFLGLQKRAPAGSSVEYRFINARPAFVLRQDGVIEGVFVLEMADGRIRAIHSIRNPDKLRYLASQA